MAIIKNYMMTINKAKSVLNKELTLSTNDRGIDICFEVLDSSYVTLSRNKDLLSKIIIKSPLGKQIESNLTPIVNGRIMFTVDNSIMKKITETGLYKLYIIIYDDRNNRNILPPLDLIINKSNIDISEIESSSVLKSNAINNIKVSSYGNVLTLYNADGSYNRTMWLNDDIITNSKMNKIEEVISDLVDGMNEAQDKIQELDDTNAIVTINGKVDNPVVISQLDKGFYIINGYVKDFDSQEAEQMVNTNYYYITGKDDTYVVLSKCLDDDNMFRKYKYNKNLETIEKLEDEIVNVRVEDGYANITDDKYQYMEVNEDCEILLPDRENFVNVNLFIMANSESSITFPKINWSTQPEISANHLTKIELFYINNSWYGNAFSY